MATFISFLPHRTSREGKQLRLPGTDFQEAYVTVRIMPVALVVGPLVPGAWPILQRFDLQDY